MQELVLDRNAVQRLLSTTNADAALLYLQIAMGDSLPDALSHLKFNSSRGDCAVAALRQLQLLPPQANSADAPPPRPDYTAQDLARYLDDKRSRFRQLVGEVQRRFGRVLSTEETKTLLYIIDCLGLPTDVTVLLLSFCLERNRIRGIERTVSVSALEKEACRWSELGVTGVERAAAYMQEQLQRYTRVGAVARILQISGRRLTPGEERYILGWLDMGFSDAVIRLAYERTLENLSVFKWSYCNAILKSWNAQGLASCEQIRNAAAPKQTAQQKRNSQFQQHGVVSELGKAAIADMLAWGEKNGIQ